jgi:chromosome segregation ATPase
LTETQKRRESIKEYLVKLMNALDPLLGIKKGDEQALRELEMSDLRPFISSFGSSALYTKYMNNWKMGKTKSGKPKPGKYEGIYRKVLEKTRAAIDLHAAEHQKAQDEFDAVVLQVNNAKVTLTIVQTQLEEAQADKSNAEQWKQQQEALLAKARQEKKQLDDLQEDLLKQKEQAEAAFKAATAALDQASQEAKQKGRTGSLLETEGRTPRLRGVVEKCDDLEDED